MTDQAINLTTYGTKFLKTNPAKRISLMKTVNTQYGTRTDTIEIH